MIFLAFSFDFDQTHSVQPAVHSPIFTAMTMGLKWAALTRVTKTPIKMSSQRDSQSVGHNHKWLRWKSKQLADSGSLSRLRIKASPDSLEIKTCWNIYFTHIMVTFMATAGTSWSWALSQTSSRSWHWHSSGTTPSTGEDRERAWLRRVSAGLHISR